MTPISEMTLSECLEQIRQGNYLDRHELADRIHSLTRWIPVSERLPTKEDADENDSVLILATRRNGSRLADVWYWDAVTGDPIGSMTPTHWRRIDTP